MRRQFVQEIHFEFLESDCLQKKTVKSERERLKDASLPLSKKGHISFVVLQQLYSDDGESVNS